MGRGITQERVRAVAQAALFLAEAGGRPNAIPDAVVKLEGIGRSLHTLAERMCEEVTDEEWDRLCGRASKLEEKARAIVRGTGAKASAYFQADPRGWSLVFLPVPEGVSEAEAVAHHMEYEISLVRL